VGEWAPSSPASRYGGSLMAGASVSPIATELTAVRGPAERDDVPALHPSSPLFWFAVIAAAAVGLMYASTTVRVGPVKVSASAGKS